VASPVFPVPVRVTHKLLRAEINNGRNLCFSVTDAPGE
jgi:hypothetical protein